MKVYSPEESETDLENPTKRKIIVYDYNWCSDKVFKYYYSEYLYAEYLFINVEYYLLYSWLIC